MSECLGRLLQPYSVDLSAIAALTGSGYARRISAGSWALDPAIPAIRGGTGRTGYSVGAMLYADTTTTLNALPLGTVGNVMAVGIGGPTWGDLTTLAVTSITGTANQVLVNGVGGVSTQGPVTLTLPQDINTGARPTFAGLTAAADIDITVPNGSTALTMSGATGDRFRFITESGGSGVIAQALNNAATDFEPLSLAAEALTFLMRNGAGTVLNVGVFTQTGLNACNLGATTRGSVNCTTVNTAGDITTVVSNGSVGWNISGTTGDRLRFIPESSGSGVIVQTLNNGSTDFEPLTISAEAVALQARTGAGVVTTVGLFSATGLVVTGSVETSAPSGGTAQPWKLGSIASAASALDTTRYVEAEINGVACKLALIS